MAKNLISGPILTRFFRGFYYYKMLDIVASYHCIKLQRKRMTQTQENGKKHHFRPDLDPLDPNSGRQFFFIKLLDIVPSYHSMQFKGKLINQTCENG